MKKLGTTILALASAAIITSSAHAQSTTVYNPGDLFIGVSSLDSSITNSYLIDIGNGSQFLSGTSFTLSLGNVGADLTAVFGANWFTNGNTVFSVFGTSKLAGQIAGDPANTLYTTNPAYDGTPGTLFARGSNSSQGGTATAMTNAANAFAGNTSTANSPFGLIQSNSAFNSYASFQSGGSFGRFQPTAELAINGAGYLQRIVSTAAGNQPGQGVYGFFSFAGDGSVTYTALVPEPSTYALLGAAGAVAGAVALRRRKAAQA